MYVCMYGWMYVTYTTPVEYFQYTLQGEVVEVEEVYG